MRVLFLGAPGSGKGTQAEKLHKALGFTILTTSNLLRAQLADGSVLGAQIQAKMEAGSLVPDALVWQVVKQASQQCINQQKKYILDGYPRSMVQLDYIQSSTVIYDYLVYFEVSDAVVIERICGRRVHPSSGRVYHVQHAPENIAGQDDITGEPLVHRKDDQLAVVRRRLVTYREKTLPVVQAVQADIAAGRGRINKILTINADQPITVVTKALQAVL